MEVRTQEVIRYIDLRFIEKDLKDLRGELEMIDNYFKTQHYQSEKKLYENLVKIKEFQVVLGNALNELKK